MSTLRPVGFQPASCPAKTTQPQFSGGTQSTQRSDNEQQKAAQPIIKRPIPSYQDRLKTAALSGAFLVAKGVCYVFPSINQKITELLTETIQDPEAPITKVSANHELGHILTSLSAGLPMEEFSLMKMDGMGGAVFVNPEAVSQATKNPADFYKVLVMLMAGHGAELNRATSDELNDPKFIAQSRLHAGGDIEDAIPLIQNAQEKGWIKLASTQIPQEINLKRLQQLASKAGRTEAETQELQKVGKQIREFFSLPIVQQALKTAREIHAVVPPEKREQIVHDLTHSTETLLGVQVHGLSQERLYDLLEKHLNADEVKRMQATSERFLKVHDKNIPSRTLQLLGKQLSHNEKDSQQQRIDTEQPSFEVLKRMSVRRPGLISNEPKIGDDAK